MAITETVMEIGKINFQGNILPPSWFIHLKRDSGKPNAIAAVLLSEIVYWYRPSVIRDEATGQIVEYRKKFKADLLQRSYDSFAEQFGFTKRQVKDALKFLQDKGIIQLIFRHITTADGRKIPNVLFIDINPERVQEISYDRTAYMLQKNVTYPTPDRHTNTKTTTENTTQNMPAGAGPPVKASSRSMFTALADVCRYDMKLITGAQRGQLNQTEKRLREAGVVPRDLTDFDSWWKAHDWRGKKGEAPRPSQVREEWGKFAEWRKANGKHGGGFATGLGEGFASPG